MKGCLVEVGRGSIIHSFNNYLVTSTLSPLLCLIGGLSLKDLMFSGRDRPIITDKTVSKTAIMAGNGGAMHPMGRPVSPEKWDILRGGRK